MKAVTSLWLAAGLVLASFAPAHAAGAAPRVVSWQSLPVDTLNAAIAAAAAAHEAWARDPIQIALRHVDARPDAVAERSDFTLRWKGNGGEQPTAGELVVIEERLGDDSIAGEWTRYRMARQADGSWRVTAWDTASRCARGTAAQQAAYHREPCP